MKKITLSIIIAFLLGATTQAQSIAYSIDSGSFSLTDLDNSTLLSAGTSAAGDGFALQLGYYSTSTVGNLFSGTWTPFAGAGTSNFSTLSIGDFNANGAGAGTFAFDLTFSNANVSLPTAGQILGLRFYNSTTVAAATAFGSMSAASWTWVSPADPQPPGRTMSLDDGGLVWLNNDVAFTGTAVPEPATYAAILGLVTLGLVSYRRFRRR